MDVKKYLDVDKHRPLAFFGIDITLGEQSVREWVRWCKAQGMRGFNIIIVTDCRGRAAEPWLSRLLTAYGWALDQAEKLGLEVWIFDDWGYPSGTAGGLVCTDKSLRAKQLAAAADVALAPHATVNLGVIEHFLSAGVYHEDGSYAPLDCKPSQPVSYTAGDSPERLVVAAWKYFGMRAKSSCKSENDPAMSLIDMLKPEAARKFTHVMHDLYKSRFHQYFGKTVKGFFYDEPYLPFEFPWTEELPAEFKRSKGYDLLPVLPRILTESKSSFKKAGPFATDFFDVWTDMAAKNYYGVMAKWCHGNGLELSGHADLDHRLDTLNTVSGHFFKNMAVNDRPAHDVIWAQIEPGHFADFPRYGASVKRLLGKKSVISETFAAMGTALTADQMRFITDYQAIRGISDFHLMYSSNRNFGPPLPPMNPYHMFSKPYGAAIIHRIAVGAAAADFGKAAGGVALYMPCADLYRWQLTIGNVGCDNAEIPIWQWVDEIAEELCYLPCSFDYIWDEAITGLPLGSGGFQTGEGYKIHTVILPPNCTVPKKAADVLNDFAARGGRIISVLGTSKGVRSTDVAFETGGLKQFIKPSVIVSKPGSLSCCVREKDGTKLFMLLNESCEPYRGIVDFGSDYLYRMDTADGTLTEMPSAKINAAFSAAEMQLYLRSDKKLSAKPEPIPAGSPVAVSGWYVETPEGSRVSLTGDMWPDWARLGFPSYSGFMNYRAHFESDGKNALRLEAPGLHYQAEVFIDGKDVGRMAFRPYSLDLGTLSGGTHTLRIRVCNTTANEICGTPELEKTYPPRASHMLAYDKKRLLSGLTAAPVLIPMAAGKP